MILEEYILYGAELWLWRGFKYLLALNICTLTLKEAPWCRYRIYINLVSYFCIFPCISKRRLENWDLSSNPHALCVSNPLATEGPRLSSLYKEWFVCIAIRSNIDYRTGQSELATNFNHPFGLEQTYCWSMPPRSTIQTPRRLGPCFPQVSILQTRWNRGVGRLWGVSCGWRSGDAMLYLISYVPWSFSLFEIEDLSADIHFNLLNSPL